MLVAYCLMSIPPLVRHMSSLLLIDEAGYGDSYIIYDVLHFRRTGTIYRDLSLPPYLPAQYSPMVYILYSLPGRIVAWESPFVGARLIVIAAFLGCIGIVISIVRTLIPVRRVWVWAPLLVCSISSMWDWTLQIRGDFPGICLSLLAIRLLLSRSRWAVPLAGICAGLAMQFKITFVAAVIAGALWLLIRQRWRHLATFAILAALSSVALYLLYAVREPRMLSQIFALSPGIADVRGDLGFMDQAVSDLVVLLAVLALPLAVSRLWPGGALIVMFAATSFAIAGLTDLQAGGNINYYFEGLFAVIPLAVLGVLRLLALARRHVTLGFFVVSLFGIHFVAPRAVLLFDRPASRSVESRNELFRHVERVLQGRHIFSTVPRLALLDPAPALMEPYLLSYMQRLGKADPTIIAERIRDSEFDVVITAAAPGAWRGISHIGPDLHDAVAAAYEPQCTLPGWLFHLPRDPRMLSKPLTQDLANIGCVPVPPGHAASW